jgi:hypothetical protein
MDARRDDIPTERLTLPLYNRLIGMGISPYAVMQPFLPEATRGMRGSNGLFEHVPGYPLDWLVFDEPEDSVLWNVRTNALARETGRAFALGEAILVNPGTCALGGALNLFESPATWLQHHRKGIVVIDWRRAYSVLSFLHVPRIAVARPLVDTFTTSMSEQYRPLVEISED